MVYIAAVGITTVIFGIASLVLISRARNRLTDGSIRRFMDNFAICLAFIVIFSLWQTLRDVYGVVNFNGQTTYLTYPEYIFMIFAYIAFIVTSLRTQKISQEFGFKEDGRKIGQLMKPKSEGSAPVEENQTAEAPQEAKIETQKIKKVEKRKKKISKKK